MTFPDTNPIIYIAEKWIHTFSKDNCACIESNWNSNDIPMSYSEPLFHRPYIPEISGIYIEKNGLENFTLSGRIK